MKCFWRWLESLILPRLEALFSPCQKSCPRLFGLVQRFCRDSSFRVYAIFAVIWAIGSVRGLFFPIEGKVEPRYIRISHRIFNSVIYTEEMGHDLILTFWVVGIPLIVLFLRKRK